MIDYAGKSDTKVVKILIWKEEAKKNLYIGDNKKGRSQLYDNILGILMEFY